MSRPVRFALPLIALFLALGIAACGDSESSADDFRAEADEVCVNQVQDFLAVEKRLGPSQGMEDEATLQERLGEVRQRSLSELEELEAPDEVAEEWDRYLQLRQQLTDLRKEQLELLREDDEKAVIQINGRIGDLNDKLDEVGKDAGLTACASVLPQDQAKEAEAVVEEVALTTNPKRVCDELVTKEYMEAGFGGSFENCAKFQRENAEDFAEEVKVEKVDGVEDLQAAVRITESGGMFDGEESVWVLHRDGGAWKVNLIAPAS